LKKLITTLALTGALLLPAGAALAAPGGAPALHGVDGRTFGGAVSGLAQSYPGAVADHVGRR
jgi:hypothetical protein